jgi:hypothetical protein
MLFLTKQMTYSAHPNKSIKNQKKFIDMIQSKLNTPILPRTGGKNSIVSTIILYYRILQLLA